MVRFVLYATCHLGIVGMIGIYFLAAFVEVIAMALIPCLNAPRALGADVTNAIGHNAIEWGELRERATKTLLPTQWNPKMFAGCEFASASQKGTRDSAVFIWRFRGFRISSEPKVPLAYRSTQRWSERARTAPGQVGTFRASESMNSEQQPTHARQPPPVCAILASVSPFICAVISFVIGVSGVDSGDFRFMIAIGYGLVGAIFGIVLAIGFAASARSRRERNALRAALITVVASALLLVMAFVSYAQFS